MRNLGIVAIGLLAACGNSDPGAGTDKGPFVDGFEPPALQAGYTRLVMPIIPDIPPGTDKMWCQWVSPPSDGDMDIVNVVGNQSQGGHHIVLYATSTIAPVGMSRPCNDADLVSLRFLGAIGGEGASGVSQGLPPGAVFRLPKGQALMANVHYVNASTHPINGQGYLDMKTAPPDPSAKVANLFVNVGDTFAIPASKHYASDVNCTVQDTMQVFFFANHMHEWGSAAFTELVHPDGTKTPVRMDKTWTKEAVFNPNLDRWPIDAPLIINKGDVVHTHCEWNNTTANELKFPHEMCVGFGVFVGANEIDCINGQWPQEL